MLVLLTALVVIFFVVPRRVDRIILNHLPKATNFALNKDVPSATDQKRQKVRKDMFVVQKDGSRLHYRIDSDASTLSLVFHKDKIGILEQLLGIKGWMK